MDDQNIIDTFNKNVQFGKYVSFAVQFVKEHREEIQGSIDGKNGMIQKQLETHPLRDSERYDIDWKIHSDVQEVYDLTIWEMARHRIISLMACCVDYTRAIGMNDIYTFLKAVEEKLPSLEFVLPDGGTVSPFELLMAMGDTFAHSSDSRCKDGFCVPEGTDLRSLALTQVCHSNDGSALNVATYVRGDKGDSTPCIGSLGCESGEYQVFEILENEICCAIRAFHAIWTGRFSDEEACIAGGFWCPLTFV